MPELFRSSHAKLKRATKFIAEVENALETYNISDPISAVWEYSGTEPAIKITWKEIDPDVLAALGDAIHNMRAALDLMACELARINGKSDRDVYFPFASSQEKFPHAIRSKNFHLAGDDAVRLIHEFAPYKGGNHRLRAIHDLDIEDKHTSILVTQHVTNDMQLHYRLDAGLTPPVQVSNAKITHNFLTAPLTGLPLIPTLNELVELVRGILEAFAAMVLRAQQSVQPDRREDAAPG